MNSRYMRPPPQGAQMPQMTWPTMNVPPPPQIAPQQGGNPLVSGLTQLGTAAVTRKDDEEPEAPVVAMPAVAPVVPEPAIPIAPPPAYGSPSESPMVKKRPSILDTILGRMGGMG